MGLDNYNKRTTINIKIERFLKKKLFLSGIFHLQYTIITSTNDKKKHWRPVYDLVHFLISENRALEKNISRFTLTRFQKSLSGNLGFIKDFH